MPCVAAPSTQAHTLPVPITLADKGSALPVGVRMRADYDGDGDGVLSHAEFAALAELVGGQTGQTFSPEHIDKCFRQADVDGSGYIDLNELLLYRRRGIAQQQR